MKAAFVILATTAWSFLAMLSAEPMLTPVSGDHIGWVGEIVKQGGGWALAVYVIWMQNRDHRERMDRAIVREEQLIAALVANNNAITEFKKSLDEVRSLRAKV